MCGGASGGGGGGMLAWGYMYLNESRQVSVGGQGEGHSMLM